ncbi:hypothetical protein KR009_002871, partial [Drosophila setifemur]
TPTMNLDLSDIIEFALPSKSEFSDEDDDGGIGVGVGSGDVGASGVIGMGGVGVGGVGDDDATYVVLDGLGNEYDEEFLIVNEDAADGELLVDDVERQQQHLDSFHELLVVGSSKLHDQHVEQQHHIDDPGEHFVVTEMQLSEMEELVEEDLDQDQDLEDYDFDYTDQPPEIEELPSPSPPATPPPPTKSPAAPQIHLRTFPARDEDEEKEVVKDVKPSDKMLEEFKGPRRYLLFDDLIATIVDFDDESTPIVEFSMISSMVDEKLPVECGICPDVMHKSKLSKHQKTHMVAGTNRYACIYCSETYRDCKYLAGHARRHMGIRPYVCEICKLYFSTKQDLRVHNQRRHLEKEHICEMCGKTFAQNTQLKRHREATHEKKRRFQCQYCQKAYYKNFSLQEHIRNVHMGKRRMLKCPFCGMQCRDAHKMARHRKEMHLNQDTYVCHLCHEEFTDINYFDAHKRSIQCRSNTRRLVGGDEDADDDGDGQGQLGSGSVSGGLQDDDNAMGLMEEDEFDEDAGLLVEESQHQQHEQEMHHYLPASEVDGDPQYVQEPDYENQRLLVEGLVAEEEDDDDEVDEELLREQQFQQLQQSHYNDELIYEITLKTEDN